MSSKMRRLAFYVVGIYVIFMYWGYLQEKLTSEAYVITSSDQEQRKLEEINMEGIEWNYPLVLNLCVALVSFCTALVVKKMINQTHSKGDRPELYWRAALSVVLASPIGYQSLKYISYPMMILAKSSKPVPVMTIGIVFYGRKYPWFKYVSIALLCCGIALFSFSSSAGKKSKSSSNEQSNSTWMLIVGLVLLMVNLSMDGYTSNEQDHCFAKHSATSLDMMKNTNMWQILYLSSYLILTWLIYGAESQAGAAYFLLSHSSEVCIDVISFCLCAAVGQILIFGLMMEYGSLAWITVSITRQLFTIVLSVFLFGHHLMYFQWFGILAVFTGLALDGYMSNINKISGKSATATTSSGTTGSLAIGTKNSTGTVENQRTRQSIDSNQTNVRRTGSKTIIDLELEGAQTYSSSGTSSKNSPFGPNTGVGKKNKAE